jgi:3-hydroxyacyl-[acyl-carrier-protein] dehydratase
MEVFFETIESTHIDNEIKAIVSFNEKHPLYQGHFPGSPITPGVIQLDIIQQILEKEIDKKVKLKTLNRCKFLAMINPNDTTHIQFNIKYSIDENNEIKTQNTISKGDKFFLKTSATFIEA